MLVKVLFHEDIGIGTMLTHNRELVLQQLSLSTKEHLDEEIALRYTTDYLQMLSPAELLGGFMDFLEELSSAVKSINAISTCNLPVHYQSCRNGTVESMKDAAVQLSLAKVTSASGTTYVNLFRDVDKVLQRFINEASFKQEWLYMEMHDYHAFLDWMHSDPFAPAELPQTIKDMETELLKELREDQYQVTEVELVLENARRWRMLVGGASRTQL